MADYKGTTRQLQGTAQDMNVFKKMSSLFSNQQDSRNLSMNEDINKEKLLTYIRNFSSGKKYINFNFAGHGEIIQGKSYIILPGYFKCLNEKNGNIFNGADLCGDFLVTGNEIENAMNGSHVFGLMASCVSGNIIQDMPNSSMIAASEPGRDILDNYGDYIGRSTSLALKNEFSGSELAGRLNDLLRRNVSCAESPGKNGAVNFADIPALIPRSNFIKDRPSGRNVRDAINSCFVLKPALPSCLRNRPRASDQTNTQYLEEGVQ